MYKSIIWYVVDEFNIVVEVVFLFKEKYGGGEIKFFYNKRF